MRTRLIELTCLLNSAVKCPMSGKRGNYALYWKQLTGRSILGLLNWPSVLNRTITNFWGFWCLSTRVHPTGTDVWLLYLFFPSELPVNRGEHWCHRCPGSRCIFSQWWGWVQTSTHPLGHRWCRPSSRHTGKDSCQESHAGNASKAAELMGTLQINIVSSLFISLWLKWQIVFGNELTIRKEKLGCSNICLRMQWLLYRLRKVKWKQSQCTKTRGVSTNNKRCCHLSEETILT